MDGSQLTLTKYGTCIYLPYNEGGFDVRNCPDAEALANRITFCVNACKNVDNDTLEAVANGATTGSEIHELAQVKAALRALLAASRPVATAAYNIGQSHAEWSSIRGHIEKFDAATQLAREVLK